MGVTGYEAEMYRNISKIAKALDRIAKALEERTYGVTMEQVEAVKTTVERERTYEQDALIDG
jgi:fido (protein-threonine AMPylation protein)